MMLDSGLVELAARFERRYIQVGQVISIAKQGALSASFFRGVFPEWFAR